MKCESRQNRAYPSRRLSIEPRVPKDELLTFQMIASKGGNLEKLTWEQ